MTHRLVTVACVALLALSARAAESDDAATAEARQHVKDAQVAYKLGEFDKSVVSWKEAYRLKPVPAILFNLAQAYRMAGEYKESRFQYQNYLRDMPNAPNRQEVERQIAQLGVLIAEQKAAEPESEPSAEPVVEKDPVEVAPPQPVVAAEPPAPELPAAAFDLPPEELESDPGLLPWIVAGAAAVLAVGGAVTYGLARGQWSEASARERPRAEVDALVAAGDSTHKVALGLGGAAALAGAGSAVLFVF